MPCFLKINPKGSRYSAKRMGPRIEPWGTPEDRGAEDDIEPPTLTVKPLPVTYDLNHSSAVPFIPTPCSR